MPGEVGDQLPIRPPEPLKPTIDAASPHVGEWWYQIIAEPHGLSPLISPENAAITPPPEQLTVNSFVEWLDHTLVTMGEGKARRIAEEKRLHPYPDIEIPITPVPPGIAEPRDAAHLLGKYLWAWHDYYVAEGMGNEARAFFELGTVVGIENVLGQFGLDGDRKVIDRLFERIPLADRAVFDKAHARIEAVYKK